MKLLKNPLVVGEESIFGELSQIIVIATEANTILIDMLGSLKNGDILENRLEKIHALEKKSDQVAFKINEHITTGAVSPNAIDNLLQSVHIADDIVDTYYYNSRELSRMYRAEFPYSEAHEESEFIAIFKSMLELADKALAKVKEILSSPNLSAILELRKEIEDLEQQGDDIKDRGFDMLYHQAPNMHYLQFYHYSELLHKFDDILDFNEDLSDLVLSIITSILK